MDQNTNQNANTNENASKEPGFFKKAYVAATMHIASNRAKYGVALGALIGVGASAGYTAYQGRRS